MAVLEPIYNEGCSVVMEHHTIESIQGSSGSYQIEQAVVSVDKKQLNELVLQGWIYTPLSGRKYRVWRQTSGPGKPRPYRDTDYLSVVLA
jgi:hypothetical protein